jgi:hypothetical protein
VISHYEQQLRTAGIAFQTTRDGTGTSIEVFAEKASCAIRVRVEDGGAKVEVNYALKRDPAPSLAAVRHKGGDYVHGERWTGS